MKIKFTRLIYGLSSGCVLAAFTTACSGGLYRHPTAKSYPNLVEIRTDKLQPMHDSLHTIVALTPMTGATVDTLFKGGDKFVIQYPTDLNQTLPTGIDVVYINTDYAPLSLADSPLFYDADSKENVKIMVDGSLKNIEKFCKTNANIYSPGAVLMVYENLPPDSSPERDIPLGALATTAYGKGYNAVSYDMLIESIFDFSVNDKRTLEDFKKAFDYTYDPKSPASIARIAKLKALKEQYTKAKPVSILNSTEPAASPLLLAGATDALGSWLTPNQTPQLSVPSNTNFRYDEHPYCDWSRWQDEAFNWLWNWNDKVYRSSGDITDENGNNISPDDKNTHLNDPGDDFHEKALFRGAYVDAANEYQNGYWNVWPLRRLNCIDNTGYFSMRVEKSWSVKPRIDAPVNSSVLTGRWVRFNTKTSKSGYLDFNITSTYTKSYGLTRTGGLAISVGGDVMGFSVETKFETSWSKSKSQDVTITKSTQNEYWFGKCMVKVSNPIYGRLEAWTKSAYADGYVQMRIRMLYAEQGSRNTKAIQYGLLNPDLAPRYQGVMRHANTYWSKAIWKRNSLASSGILKNFGKCGAPKRKGAPKY